MKSNPFTIAGVRGKTKPICSGVVPVTAMETWKRIPKTNPRMLQSAIRPYRLRGTLENEPINRIALPMTLIIAHKLLITSPIIAKTFNSSINLSFHMLRWFYVARKVVLLTLFQFPFFCHSLIVLSRAINE
jgi:hypothetical protein